MRAALKMRCSARIPFQDAVCVFDLAEELEVEVRFTDIPSMEAVYVKEPGPVIVVSSLRPAGRRAFNCAHELGHHVFGHGSRVDEVREENAPKRFDPEEFAADCFAGYLLMPKLAVCRGFAARKWTPQSATALQVYTVAGWLGVGYSTLISHMRSSLGLLGPPDTERLLATTPKQLRQAVLGDLGCGELVIADGQWTGRAIDVQVGDVIVAPRGTTVEGQCAEVLEDVKAGAVVAARSPGLGQVLDHTGWAAFVRVSRAGFVGRCAYRHFEEADDE